MQVKDTGFCDAAAAFTDIHNTPCDQVLKSYIKGSHVLTAILGGFHWVTAKERFDYAGRNITIIENKTSVLWYNWCAAMAIVLGIVSIQLKHLVTLYSFLCSQSIM